MKKIKEKRGQSQFVTNSFSYPGPLRFPPHGGEKKKERIEKRPKRPIEPAGVLSTPIMAVSPLFLYRFIIRLDGWLNQETYVSHLTRWILVSVSTDWAVLLVAREVIYYMESNICYGGIQSSLKTQIWEQLKNIVV